MATRGCFGFRKDGVNKLVYCHFDSYPGGLGSEFVEFLRWYEDEKLSLKKSVFDSIIQVDSSKEPTLDIKEWSVKNKVFDLEVSKRTLNDWYCLLRGLQSPLAWRSLLIKNQPIYIDSADNEFIKDTWCEYAYIYDLDKKKFKYYSLPAVPERGTYWEIPFDVIEVLTASDIVGAMNVITEIDCWKRDNLQKK